MAIQKGDTIPSGTFTYVPWSPELEGDKLACGVPIKLSTDEWKGKKVVLFTVPGAFTPSCHANHLPGYIKNYDALKAKGVDIIAVVAANDPFVMSGWARVEGLKSDILALTDTNLEWAEKAGLTLDLSGHGLGQRTTRSALVINPDGTVGYVGVEKVASDVTVSGADAVLAAL